MEAASPLAGKSNILSHYLENTHLKPKPNPQEVEMTKVDRNDLGNRKKERRYCSSYFSLLTDWPMYLGERVTWLKSYPILA